MYQKVDCTLATKAAEHMTGGCDEMDKCMHAKKQVQNQYYKYCTCKISMKQYWIYLGTNYWTCRRKTNWCKYGQGPSQGYCSYRNMRGWIAFTSIVCEKPLSKWYNRRNPRTRSWDWCYCRNAVKGQIRFKNKKDCLKNTKGRCKGGDAEGTCHNSNHHFYNYEKADCRKVKYSKHCKKGDECSMARKFGGGEWNYYSHCKCKKGKKKYTLYYMLMQVNCFGRGPTKLNCLGGDETKCERLNRRYKTDYMYIQCKDYNKMKVKKGNRGT